MEEILRLLGIQPPPPPQTDRDGIALPPQPGETVGQPQQPGGLMGHYGNMTNGQPMDPTMMQMLLRMLGRGQ
jgi:hypothetical protein